VNKIRQHVIRAESNWVAVDTRKWLGNSTQWRAEEVAKFFREFVGIESLDEDTGTFIFVVDENEERDLLEAMEDYVPVELSVNPDIVANVCHGWQEIAASAKDMLKSEVKEAAKQILQLVKTLAKREEVYVVRRNRRFLRLIINFHDIPDFGEQVQGILDRVRGKDLTISTDIFVKNFDGLSWPPKADTVRSFLKSQDIQFDEYTDDHPDEGFDTRYPFWRIPVRDAHKYKDLSKTWIGGSIYVQRFSGRLVDILNAEFGREPFDFEEHLEKVRTLFGQRFGIFEFRNGEILVNKDTYDFDALVTEHLRRMRQ